MLLVEDYECQQKSIMAAHAKNAQSAVSPPSNQYMSSELGTPKKATTACGAEKGEHQTLDKAWTRQTSYYTQVSKTRDILPVLKDLVASLE